MILSIAFVKELKMTQTRRKPIVFSLPQTLALCEYLKANYKEQSDTEFAIQASEALGFKINRVHIYSYRNKLNIQAGRIAKSERIRAEGKKASKISNTDKIIDFIHYQSKLISKFETEKQAIIKRLEHLELRLDTYFNTKKEKL